MAPTAGAGSASIHGLTAKPPARPVAAGTRGGESVSSQEVSRPVMIAAIAVAVIVIGLFAWYYFGRQERYPGFQAPQGGPRASGMMPGQAPGGGNPQPAGPH